MFKPAVRFLAALFASFVLLCAMWVSAARASEMVCYSRPLEQGKVGEMVKVCEMARAVRGSTVIQRRDVKRTARLGQTIIVARLGARS